jgi:hypothetical protein
MDQYSLIENALINELNKRLDQVISGEKDVVQIKFLYASDVESVLTKEYGANVDTSEMDTNGWQYDYWIPVYINDKKYVLSGSGYYGNIEFYREDEEEWQWNNI